MSTIYLKKKQQATLFTSAFKLLWKRMTRDQWYCNL